MILTSALLVTMVQKLGALSSNQAGLTNSDFFNYANLLLERVTKEILKTREEYLIYRDSLPVTIGQDTYRIPYRSVDGRLRHLWFQNPSGGRQQLHPGYIENVEGFTATDTGPPMMVYVQGNNLVFLPPPSTAGTLYMTYPFRPNQIVDSTTCATITAVNYITNTVTIANVPTNFTSGALYDLIENRSGNNIQYYDQVGTIAGSTIAFPIAIPNVVVGNYVAQAGQSPVPMIPECAHNLLLELIVERIEETRGNEGRIKNSNQRVTEEMDTCVSLLSKRIVSKAPVAGGGNPLTPTRRI